MHTLTLTDWVTVGGTGQNSVVQDRESWLDSTPLQDAIFWLEVRQVNAPGGTLTITYETSPLEDDLYFTQMFASGVTMTASGSPTQSAALLRTARVPIATWVRWRITPSAGVGTNNWDTTFRVWVVANSPGA